MLGIGDTLCDASPIAIEGAQIHLRHGRMGVTMTLVVVAEEGTLGLGCRWGWRSVRQSRWRGERYRIGIGGDGQDGIEI